MSRLRSYGPMKRESAKVRAGAGDFQAVYAEVDARSEGRCEVTLTTGSPIVSALARGVVVDNWPVRCSRRAVEHHHLFQPRRSHHTAAQVIHICRACHDRATWPYKRGRLDFIGRMGEAFLFALRYAASKFEARGQGQ